MLVNDRRKSSDAQASFFTPIADICVHGDVQNCNASGILATRSGARSRAARAGRSRERESGGYPTAVFFMNESIGAECQLSTLSRRHALRLACRHSAGFAISVTDGTPWKHCEQSDIGRSERSTIEGPSGSRGHAKSLGRPSCTCSAGACRRLGRANHEPYSRIGERAGRANCLNTAFHSLRTFCLADMMRGCCISQAYRHGHIICCVSGSPGCLAWERSVISFGRRGGASLLG